MKIIVVIKKSPAKRYLIHIQNEENVNVFMRFIGQGMRSQAIVFAFAEGVFEKELSRDELEETRADLVLSEYSSSWDITS